MNYSTLLQRSVDFDVFKTILVPAYPDPVDRAIGLAAVQMLWDPAEAPATSVTWYPILCRAPHRRTS